MPIDHNRSLSSCLCNKYSHPPYNNNPGASFLKNMNKLKTGCFHFSCPYIVSLRNMTLPELIGQCHVVLELATLTREMVTPSCPYIHRFLRGIYNEGR